MKLRDISIRKKVGVSFIGLIIIALIACIINFSIISKLMQQSEVKSTTAAIVQLMADARKAEQDFILYDRKKVVFLEEGTSPSIEKHHYLMNHLGELILQLSDHRFVRASTMQSDLQAIMFSVAQYTTAFESLRQALFKRGFKDHGMELQMRSYVHALQECFSPEEKVFAYSMRRHEKDFMLRKDLSYQDKLHATANDFKQYVTNSDDPHMSASYKQETIQKINAYQQFFDKLVALEERIGLTEHDGINGELLKSAASIEPRVAHLQAVINEKHDEVYRQSVIVFVTTLSLMIIIGLLLNRLIHHGVTKRIVALDNVTHQFISGHTDISDQLNLMSSADEVGSLSVHFHKMLIQVKDNMQLIEQKNTGLQKAAEDERLRRWHVEGLAKFADLMKVNETNLEEMCSQILAELVKYIGVNQGAFFTKEIRKDQAVMHLKSCYAYGRRKYVKQEVLEGEGLVGQVWQEGSTVYITDVPQSYMKITSGLGEATADALLIVPIQSEDGVEGVIEMASFGKIDDHKRLFVTELANKLAAVIQSLKLQIQTRVLLENAQQMTEELKAQEEEMRQNMEELQATQEEMHRNSEELTKELQYSKEQLSLFDGLVSRVYEGLLFTDEQLNIYHANQFIYEKLGYRENELRGLHIEQVIKSNMRKLAASLQNDPAFMVTGFSESREVPLMDKMGNTKMVRLVLSKVSVENNASRILFLTDSRTKESGRKKLRQLIELGI